MYPPLQQDLNRVRHISQNQNTLELNRQIIHPRQNRHFQTPGVHFIIPQSPTSKPPLQQDLNRVRHISQNQNTLEKNRQIIHPRQNRHFQTPGVHFIIPQSPTSTRFH